MIEQVIREMRHSPSHNYVIPGLTSWLIGTPNKEHGCVRLFTMDRNHVEPIIPHSHRFDFVCRVLRGHVINRIWKEDNIPQNDPYMISDVTYEGVLGKHQKTEMRVARFGYSDSKYYEGEEYGMKAKDIHSIYFSKGAEVLFFEGPPVKQTSIVLEPMSQGEVVPLFTTEPWMFKK